MPGNMKAPGGYAFRTAAAALRYAHSHGEAGRYLPYQIELPVSFAKATTGDFEVAQKARHEWHMAESSYNEHCGVCKPRYPEALDCRLLVVPAALINPDTDLPA
jgi:hypothetical protein